MKFLVFGLLSTLIIFRYFSQLPKYQNNDTIRINTIITSEPIVYADSQYLRLVGLKIYLPKYPQVTYGDRVEIVGIVEDGVLDVSDIKLSQNDSVKLYKLRRRLISFYKSILPEPHASLVAGVTLGSKQMPQSFWEMLKSSGTAHVVVASGTNVTMVASFLMGLTTSFLSRKKAIVATLVGISIYVVLSGFDAPIIRAAIMGGVAFISQEVGRLASAFRSLLYTIIIMLVIKPSWIMDLGFILSVLATFGILIFNSRLDSLFKAIPKILREGLTTSLSAQIFVSPVIFATFGQFNILSPFINALILWVVPSIMIIGAASAVISLILPEIGEIILYLSYPLTLFFTKMIEIFN